MFIYIEYLGTIAKKNLFFQARRYEHDGSNNIIVRNNRSLSQTHFLS